MKRFTNTAARILAIALAVSNILTVVPIAALEQNSTAGSYQAESAVTDSIKKDRAQENTDITSQKPAKTVLDPSAAKAAAIKKEALDTREKSQIIVKYKDANKKESLKNRLKSSFKQSKFDTVRKFAKNKAELLEIGKTFDIKSVIEEIKKDPNVEYVQPNYKLSTLETDDTDNVEMSVNIPSAEVDTFNSLENETAIGTGINAEKAWELTKGGSVVVGIIDSGISISHKDLAANIYINKNEIPGNKIDDDNNGYIDDVNGWDFANGDNTVEDQFVNIHGTHVAGIISASLNSGGISGVAPESKILPLKFINGRSGYTSDAIEAIEYAKTLGVGIINCSWGSERYNPALKDAMRDSDILFVCAAGNEGRDVLSTPIYPACFDLPNILSVAAVDENNNLTEFSNYGDEADLAAPGVDIFSTFPANIYGRLSGTSMSAAFVSGVAALLKSYQPGSSVNDIVEALESNTIYVDALKGKVSTGGVVNAYGALKNIRLRTAPSKEYLNDPVNTDDSYNTQNGDTVNLSTSNPLKYNKYNSGQYIKEYNEDVQKIDGSLIITNDLLSLKGRNGLDLNLKLVYDSNQAGLIEPDFDYYLYQNTYKYDTYTQKYGNIGVGWIWDFPYIENCDEYLHLSNGSIYKIEMTSTVGDSNLKDYTLKDLRIEVDRSFSSGGMVSELVLIYKDGRKEYFDFEGRLIGIADRFNNSIKLEYYNDYDNNKLCLQRITDTVGRVITFNYSQSTEYKTLTISMSDPGSPSIVLTSKKIYAYNDDKYTLISIKDMEQRTTMFEYTFTIDYFNFFSKKANSDIQDGFNMHAYVSKVTYPTGAYTPYNYGEVTGNLGAYGFQEYNRVIRKSDYTNGNEYKYKNFTYTQNDYTGYPTHDNPEELPSNFISKMTFEEINGIKTSYTFNNKHLLTKNELRDGDGITSLIEYLYYDNRLPSRKSTKTYKKSTSSYMDKIENYQYNDFGDLVYYWSPLAGGETNNNKYKTSYTYESMYHYITQKIYMKDDDTTITESYTPDSYDNRKIGLARIFENSSLKQQTGYVYDAYGNIIEERKYKDGFTEYISTFYSYDDNDATRYGMFNGVYLTRKLTSGVRDADGTLVAAKTGNTTGNVDEIYKYDWFGNNIEAIDGNGNKTSYNYDKIGRIERETHNIDGSFKEWTYKTDTQENSVVITDENWNSSPYSTAGSCIKLIYDGLGNLLYEQAYGKNPATGTEELVTTDKYYYTSDGRLSTGEDLINGLKTMVKYYKDGRIKSKQTWNTKNGYGLGNYTEDYTYDDAYESGSYQKTTKTISGDANVQKITINTYTDKMGRLVKQERLHDSTTAYTDTYQYDYVGNKIIEKIARAYDEPAVYQYGDYTTQYNYDYAGNVVKTTNLDGTYATSEYDALGRLKRTADFKSNLTTPASYWTTYEYDNLGRLVKETIPFESTYYTTKKHYYDRNGNITGEMVSANKPGAAVAFNLTGYEYNGRNMLTKVTTYNNGSPVNYTQYYYNFAGNKLRMYTGLSSPLNIVGLDIVTPIADSVYNITKYEYGRVGKPIRMTDPMGYIESYVYDLDGNMLQKTDRNGSISTMTYDGSGRLLTENVYNPDMPSYNTSLSYTYILDGKRASMSSGGSSTIYTYDDLGRLVSETEGQVTKEYTYDAADNRKSFILKVNGVVKTNTSYTYDIFNRLSQVYENGQITAAYTYDKNGNRQTLTYANGDSESYTYNLANKVVSLTNKKGAAVLSGYTYEYSLDGNQTKKTDNTGKATSYTYDGLGRLTSEAPAGGNTVSYTYDDSNNRRTMTAGSAVTTYDYDKDSRLTEENRAVTNYTFKYDYSQNVTWTWHGFDIPVDTNSNYTFSFDAFISDDANIAVTGSTFIADGEAGFNTGFYYDNTKKGTWQHFEMTQKPASSIARMLLYPTTSSIPATAGYILYKNVQFKKVGSILNLFPQPSDNSGFTMRGNGVVNSIVSGVSQEVTRYGYDRNGNQIYKGTETVKPIVAGETEKLMAAVAGENIEAADVSLSEYDGLNRLIRVATGNIIAAYTYNGDGLRTSKTVNGLTTLHIWDGGQLAIELDGNGVLSGKYIRGVNLIAAEDGVGARKYYLFNGHSDVVQLTNSSGDVVKNYDYDAFGNEKNPDASDTNMFRYCGEYFDIETNTYYLRARNYDPTTGRFLSEDSNTGRATDPLSLNLYTYCRNNPIIYLDPTGNTPYVVENSWRGGYGYFWSGRGTDFITTFLYYIPFTSALQNMSLKICGFEEIDGSTAKGLMSILQNIKDNNSTSTTLDVLSTLEKLAKVDKLPNVMKTSGKYIGKAASAIGTGFNIWDTIKFFNDDGYVADQIINWTFIGNNMYASTKEGVEKKYLYATMALKKLISQGKITYKTDWLGNITDVNYNSNDIDNINSVLEAIDKEGGKN